MKIEEVQLYCPISEQERELVNKVNDLTEQVNKLTDFIMMITSEINQQEFDSSVEAFREDDNG